MTREVISDRRIVARFMKFVEKGDDPDDCWKWNRSTTFTGGYGRFFVDGKERSRPAHEVSYRIFIGPVPNGHEMRHNRRCKCVNPLHLTTGTKDQNIHDQIKQGSSTRGERHGSSILTEEQVLYIRSGSKSPRELATELGVHYNTVKHVLRKTSWAWLE